MLNGSGPSLGFAEIPGNPLKNLENLAAKYLDAITPNTPVDCKKITETFSQYMDLVLKLSGGCPHTFRHKRSNFKWLPVIFPATPKLPKLSKTETNISTKSQESTQKPLFSEVFSNKLLKLTEEDLYLLSNRDDLPGAIPRFRNVMIKLLLNEPLTESDFDFWPKQFYTHLQRAVFVKLGITLDIRLAH